MIRSIQLLGLALAMAFTMTVTGCESMSKGHDDEGATETQIQMDAVPASVRDAFNKAYPGAQVSEVEKEVYPNGTVHYGFEFTHNGKRMEVEFDEDGERLPEH
jgi:hypothetical protein